MPCIYLMLHNLRRKRQVVQTRIERIGRTVCMVEDRIRHPFATLGEVRMTTLQTSGEVVASHGSIRTLMPYMDRMGMNPAAV